MPPGMNRLFPLIFLCAGLLMLGIAVYCYSQTSQFVRVAAHADGRVIALRASRSRSKSGSSVTYSPVVRFRTATNQEIEFTSNFSSSPPMHRVGDTVAVLYRRETPRDAQVADFWSLWFAPILLTGMGTGFTAVGAAMFKWRQHLVFRSGR